jgi:trimethylamine:corrinoid methyltransferase-like protein
MLDRARDRVRSILARHEPPPLPAGAEEKIAAILRAAEERQARQ